MTSLPLLNEETLPLLVSYSLSSDEEMSTAIVDAFLAADIDVYDKLTNLADWINTDVTRDLRWSSGRPIYLCTRIWDHQVVVTAEEIRIYSPQYHD